MEGEGGDVLEGFVGWVDRLRRAHPLLVQVMTIFKSLKIAWDSHPKQCLYTT